MKKRNILLGIIVFGILVFAGCVQQENGEVTRIKQDGSQSSEMQANAPKDSETGNQKEEELVKNAEEAAKAQAEQQVQDTLEKDNSSQAEMQSELISKEEALNIVLNKVSGATEANVQIELEREHGYWKYEGEIHYNGKEYEFELNAENGKIMEWTEEIWDD